MEKLAEQRSVTKQELDEANTKQVSAQAAYEMAACETTAERVESEAGRPGGSGGDLMRNDTKINAPFAGLVIAKSTQPGDLVRPGTPLLTLEQAGRVPARSERRRIET